ncbi:hypothetical protein EV424DRAFT_1607527 [Suillus variegatus]|nr:hypothetical protein EV424DRAFT_1607527 [Suillus variegatus]
MTQNLPPSSSQADTMVSVRLDGLINFLQCLSLDDRKALTQALDTSTGGDRDTSDDSLTIGTRPGSIEMPAPVASFDIAAAPGADTTPTSASTAVPTAPPAAAPTVVPTEPITVHVGYDEYDSSDDEDASNAAIALANNSTLSYYHGTYFNVPVDVSPPLYYVTRGRHIGIFSGWDATGPKVLGVSRAIFRKVDSIEQGISILKGVIDRGDTSQCVVHMRNCKSRGTLLNMPQNILQIRYHLTSRLTDFVCGPPLVTYSAHVENRVLTTICLHVNVSDCADGILDYGSIAHILTTNRFNSFDVEGFPRIQTLTVVESEKRPSPSERQTKAKKMAFKMLSAVGFHRRAEVAYALWGDDSGYRRKVRGR